MSVVTYKDGKTEEAFDLIMKKEFAYQILRGQKQIEFRNFNTHYCKRFFADEKNLEFKPINKIHFHDYNNTWFLDVQMYGNVALMPLIEEERWYFDAYECSEAEAVIDEASENKLKRNSKKTRWYFCLPIMGVINTNLDTTGIDVLFIDKNTFA